MGKIIHFDELVSTNQWAHQHLEELEDFDIVSCDIQSQGHGQFNRTWISSNKNGGNIYLSIILKPNNITHLAELTRFCAVIVAKTLETYGLKPTFKYPNDVLVNNKKISGILAESEFLGSHLKGVIVGVGINLNLEVEDLEKIDQSATSIYFETGKNVDKNEFMKLFLDNFTKEYNNFLINGIKGEILC